MILPSYHEAIKDLPDADRLQMYDAIIRYGLYGEAVELSGVAKALFTLIKPNIDSSQTRYRAAKANGEKGGRPAKNQSKNQIGNQSKNQNENQNQNQTKNQSINHDIDSDFDSETDSEFERESDTAPAPAPPTVEDVREYCLAEGISDSSVQRFVDYYAARDWKAKGEPVSDWRALFRVWADREYQKPAHVTTFMDLPNEPNVEREQRRKELGLDW